MKGLGLRTSSSINFVQNRVLVIEKGTISAQNQSISVIFRFHKYLFHLCFWNDEMVWFPFDVPTTINRLELNQPLISYYYSRWRTNFFISQPILFGTWDGVFTSVLINIFGVIVFLRSGWIVAQAGILNGVLIVIATVSVALISVLSAVGICERCRVESGGVYFLIAHTMGKHNLNVGLKFFGEENLQFFAHDLFLVSFRIPIRWIVGAAVLLWASRRMRAECAW